MDICQEETEYKWFEAARFYEQKLKSESSSGVLAAEIWQKIGFCYNLASRQAKNVKEFNSLRSLGIRAYERAAGFFGEEKKQEYTGKHEECLAIAEYLRSWLASDNSEKIKILEECRSLAKKAMKFFKAVDALLCYGQTANLLSKCLYELVSVAPNGEERNRFAEEGLHNVNEAISVLSKLEDNVELLLAFSLASIHLWYSANISESEDRRKKLANDSLSYAINHLNLVYQDSLIAECYTTFMAQTYCELASDFSASLSEKLFYLKKALASGKKGLEYAMRSGTPGSMLTSLHVLSKVYYCYSNLEHRKDRKPELLREALNYRREYLKTAENTFPSNTWICGVSKVYAGQIERDLSRIESNEKVKIANFKNAIASIEDGISGCKNWC